MSLLNLARLRARGRFPRTGDYKSFKRGRSIMKREGRW